MPAGVRLLPRPLESERITLRGEAAHNEKNAPRPSRGGRATSRELAVVLAQSSDGVGARADVSPPTALVSQEVDAPRRFLLLLLLLLSLVVDERVAVLLVLLVAVAVLRVEIHLGDRRAEACGGSRRGCQSRRFGRRWEAPRLS